MSTSDRDKMTHELAKTLGISMPSQSSDGFDEEYIPEPPAEFVMADVKTNIADVESDIRDDYVYARQLLYSLIDLAKPVLAESARVATNEKNPMTFRAFKEMGEFVQGLSKDLIGLQKVAKEVTKDKPEFNTPPNQTTNTTNNLTQFITSEEIIRRAQEEMERDKQRKSAVIVDAPAK